VRLRHGHRTPCGHGGVGGKGSPGVELWRGGWRRHRHVTGDPSGGVEAAWAHRGGSAPWRRQFNRAWQCLMTVEARGHQRHALTSPADGEGDGEGEPHAITEGRRKIARGGGYHREQ
jgi:hypothetical protein